MKKQIHLLRGAVILLALLAISSTTFADFVIKGNAKVKVLSGTSLTSNVDVSMSESAVLTNDGTVTLKGDFTNYANADLGTGEFIFAGGEDQFIQGTTESRFNHLKINKDDNGSVIVSNSNFRVESSFDMTMGVIILGNYNVTVGEAITEIANASTIKSMIITEADGELRKEYDPDNLLEFKFPLGDRTGTWEQSPMYITPTSYDLNTGVTSGHYIGVRATNEKQPNNHSTDHILNRYWSVGVPSGIFNDLVYNANGFFPEADYTGSGDINDLYQAIFVSPEWFLTTPIAPTVAPYFISMIGQTTGGDITGVEFQYLAGLTVYLAGPYNSNDTRNDMNTRVRHLNYLPLTANEAFSYLSYDGPEAVADTSDFPINTVDWVLVEIRDAATPGDATSSTQTVAGLLLSNGSIVSVDGVSALPFKNTISANAYFVVIHRNHLNVLSAGTATKPNSTYIYDFSDAPTKAYGSIQLQIDTNPIRYGMYAGDNNATGIITNADKVYVDKFMDDPGYLRGDCNLTGIISNADKVPIDSHMNTAQQIP